MEHSADGRNRSETSSDIVAICQELSSSLVSTEKNVNYARNIIQRLFKNRNIDLCSILIPRSNAADEQYDSLMKLIDQNSPFFTTVIEDDSLCDELWNEIVASFDRTCMDPKLACQSVLYSALSLYIIKLLPCDESVVNKTPQRATKTHQTIRTPLQMFRPTSPLVNRISIEDRQELMASNVNLQPKFVTLFCSLMHKVCSTEKFPTSNRVFLLRYLIKQFHIFCLHETSDEYTDTLKMAMFNEAPFKSELYNFFLTCLHHCPTVSFFTDLAECYLAYCRPWRYENAGPNDPVQIPKFLPFAKKNFEFYHTLLGKIIKKFASFEVTLEVVSKMRTVIEFSWREPHCLILRNIGLDVQPHVFALLEQMKTVVNVHRSIIEKEKNENNGFWSNWLGKTSNKSKESEDLVREIQEIMAYCDKFLGTKLLIEDNHDNGAAPNESQIFDANKTNMRSILNETPKTIFNLPEHAVDARTNLMILTADGKKQILNGERKFDYSKCNRNSLASPANYEFSPLVKILTFLAEELSNWQLVEKLASQYSEPTVTGQIARIFMFPPVPNPDPNEATPVYSPRIKRVPPLLKLRIFANVLVIFSISYFIMAQFLGRYFVIPTAMIGFFVLIYAVADQADASSSS